ncbi:MAG TPA: tRNA nucleotidyltransferase, partial [Prolixibacteraceae bacterium]|nr:tRNA nucleotidyltransferase [Prolixibacteraceae bacterium]
MMDFSKHIDSVVFKAVAKQAQELGVEAYVIGGFVRDLVLGRPSKDVDFVTTGDGIELASKVAHSLNPRIKVNYFKNFGTAQFNYQ